MQYRSLGKSGINASVVAFGSWVTGGGAPWGGKTDDAESIRAMHAAIDHGVNLIDTAPAYGFGHSETVVGKAIADRRSKVLIATKCGLRWEDTRGSKLKMFDGRQLYLSLRPDTIQIEIEQSLSRLGVETIDLYQCHWPAIEPEKTPMEETMACLMKLKSEGKIRAIGVSNFSLEQIRQADAAAELSSDQARYSLLTRGLEDEILPYCVDRNIAMLAYQPLEQGLLTGKVTMDRQFKETETRGNPSWNPWFPPGPRRRVLDMLVGWKDLAEKYDCTLAQLTIAGTLAQRGVTHVLCGARTAQQAIDNAHGGGLQLATEDVARMRRDAEALGTPE